MNTEHYSNLVYQRAMHILKNAHTSQDIVQHVMMKFHQQPTEKVEGHEEAWLMTVTRNSCLKHIDRNKRYVLMEPEAFVEHVDESPSPYDVVDQQEQHQLRMNMLQQAMQQIPARQQQLLHLRYHNNMSYQEMAREMGLTEGNVGFLINKTKNTLKNFMRHHDGRKLERAGLI